MEITKIAVLLNLSGWAIMVFLCCVKYYLCASVKKWSELKAEYYTVEVHNFDLQEKTSSKRISTYKRELEFFGNFWEFWGNFWGILLELSGNYYDIFWDVLLEGFSFGIFWGKCLRILWEIFENSLGDLWEFFGISLGILL